MLNGDIKTKMLKKVGNFLNEYFSLGLRIILILSIINAGYSGLWHIMSTNLFLLILLLIPLIIKKSSRITLPKEFEIIILIFIITTFFLDRGQGIIVPLFFGIATGIVGFLTLLILNSESGIKRNPFMISLFSFNFAVSFGFGLEFLKYIIKIMLNQEINGLYSYAMNNMAFVILGALIASTIGYLYLSGYKRIFSKIVERFKKTNPHLFSKKDLEKNILREIKDGENEKREFKSTLRVNLHTGEIDKKIENSVLKTIVAFLNTDGGTLLIGIDDKGELIGIEKDRFENKDKFSLYLTSLIKQKIGNENIPLINSRIFKIEEKEIMKIECLKSEKPVFLRMGNIEEFYIRAGPSSSKIDGKKLLEYVEKRFKKSKEK